LKRESFIFSPISSCPPLYPIKRPLPPSLPPLTSSHSGSNIPPRRA
jgi:hypothetical protein